MDRVFFFDVGRSLALSVLILAACDKTSGSAAPLPSASPPTGAARDATTSNAQAGAEPARTGAPANAAGAPFQIVFHVHDVSADPTTGVRAKLQVKTSGGQTFDYKTPVSHSDCYLLASVTSAPSQKSIDGDEAHLMCSGGGQTDQATVLRKEDTLVEVSVFQKDFEAPDTPPSKAKNTQTFSIPVPAGARLRTTVESASAGK